MSHKTFIYSIPRKSVVGLDRFTNETSGKSLQKTKMGGCKDTLMVLYSPKVGGLANYISYTPWIEEGKQVTSTSTGEQLMLQEKYEKKWNKPKGYFTNEPVRKNDSYSEKDLTYFQTKQWRMNDGCTVLDHDIMDEEMGYFMSLASTFVANSQKEWMEHKWPKALYYIALQDESDDLKYTRNEVRGKAIAALYDPNLTDSFKSKFVVILGIGSSRSTFTYAQVMNLLQEYIEHSQFIQGSNIDKFNELYRLLKSAKGKEEIEARYLLQQALDHKVVYEKNGTYVFSRSVGPLTLGERYSEAIEFLLSPKKSADVEEIISEIKKKQ